MAKATVGEVYVKIIKDTIELSRIDFEEGGVDAAALEVLRSEWQTKLSALGTVALPWDPPSVKEEKPNIKRQSSPPPAASSNGNVSRPQAQTQHSLNTLPPIKSEHFKSEHPTYPPQQSSPPTQQFQQMPIPQGRPMEAQQRAAQLLQGRFGEQASQQVARLNGTLPNQSMPQHAGSYIKTEDGTYIKPDQTDGAGDDLDTWQTEYARRKALYARSRAEKTPIRDQVMIMQQQLEGGGLLVPLSDHDQLPSGARRAMDQSARPSSSVTRAQADASNDDDEEEDVDAINSDLDDPDELDGLDEDEEEAPIGRRNVMLSTYDKVQRVKNKWKCTLKDVVLRVDGNEYLFHKAQGEFEW
ncbi:Transcription initiation factor IIA large subunit [Cyphellophora attinorum]|uniref:Transcription initiation factor IIA large subunit n=1 Tax=Cyphellophora attinorum TaxID=1664694 RepID=A0A0N1HVJ8_9EURO|nr:Transcription initiation factor IIA large subunit [Phialophora attinorum]KPI41332.1 Transcription initiation factor IIA large subunit [Phialophora attinorum]